MSLEKRSLEKRWSDELGLGKEVTKAAEVQRQLSNRLEDAARDAAATVVRTEQQTAVADNELLHAGPIVNRNSYALYAE